MSNRKEIFEAAKPIIEHLDEVEFYGFAEKLAFRVAVGDFDRALHHCAEAVSIAIAHLEQVLDSDGFEAGRLSTELDNLERIEHVETMIRQQRDRWAVRAARESARRRNDSSLTARSITSRW